MARSQDAAPPELAKAAGHQTCESQQARRAGSFTGKSQMCGNTEAKPEKLAPLIRVVMLRQEAKFDPVGPQFRRKGKQPADGSRDNSKRHKCQQKKRKQAPVGAGAVLPPRENGNNQESDGKTVQTVPRRRLDA